MSADGPVACSAAMVDNSTKPCSTLKRVMDLFTFLEQMGGLHDSRVQAIVWNPTDYSIEFRFVDIYSNFLGLPEYPGKQSGVVVLHGIREMHMSIDASEPLRVFEFLQHDDQPDEVLVTFSPGGHMRIRFERAEYTPAGLQTKEIKS
jgi:hypothetical protein